MSKLRNEWQRVKGGQTLGAGSGKLDLGPQLDVLEEEGRKINSTLVGTFGPIANRFQEVCEVVIQNQFQAEMRWDPFVVNSWWLHSEKTPLEYESMSAYGGLRILTELPLHTNADGFVFRNGLVHRADHSLQRVARWCQEATASPGPFAQKERLRDRAEGGFNLEQKRAELTTWEQTRVKKWRRKVQTFREAVAAKATNDVTAPLMRAAIKACDKLEPLLKETVAADRKALLHIQYYEKLARDVIISVASYATQVGPVARPGSPVTQRSVLGFLQHIQHDAEALVLQVERTYSQMESAILNKDLPRYVPVAMRQSAEPKPKKAPTPPKTPTPPPPKSVERRAGNYVAMDDLEDW